MTSSAVNVATQLASAAKDRPDAVAIVAPRRGGYDTITFRELDHDSNRIARGLQAIGVTPGTRLALLVPPSIDFITLVFALLKSGAVTILIDPGMGKKNLLQCLTDSRPEGFVAIAKGQLVRRLFAKRFPQAKINVTVGRRWLTGGVALDKLRRDHSAESFVAPTSADDPAAIIFTTGSTGPPKGVLYRHEMFDAQARLIRDRFGITAGEVDLPGFPLFGLFNCAMGVTTVIPDMDPTRPAEVDPPRILRAMRDWNVTQAFGSPAMWNRISLYCEQHNQQIPTLRRVLSAGAPVPPEVLQRMMACIAESGEMHTPYGATEALPVASISAAEVLGETALLTAQGAGTCVGSRFPEVEWKVIRITDGPIDSLADVQQLPTSEIGELIVCGSVISREYATRVDANRTGKIPDGNDVWHRMGDVGYLDAKDRFWFCGRMAHRVQTAEGTMFTIPCEAIFNQHEDVYRSALVGVGPASQQRPVLVVEPLPGRFPRSPERQTQFERQLGQLAAGNPKTNTIGDFLFHESFPVDIRHNSKIFREKLSVWAAGQIT